MSLINSFELHCYTNNKNIDLSVMQKEWWILIWKKSDYIEILIRNKINICNLKKKVWLPPMDTRVIVPCSHGNDCDFNNLYIYQLINRNTCQLYRMIEYLKTSGSRCGAIAYSRSKTENRSRSGNRGSCSSCLKWMINRVGTDINEDK